MSQESLPFDSESWNAQSASVAAASDNDLAVALVELAETIAEEIDDSQSEQGATTSELREQLTAKVLSTLRADAERSEGTISREDLERQCFRRSLTVGECLYVESELLAAGVVVGEATADDLAPIHSASPSTERRTSQNSGRFLDEVQERELGRKIQLFLRAKNSHEISPQEQLNRLMSEAIDAKAAFVETNIRWLRQTSSRFARTKHLTEEDLFQEGVFGLIRATELWDPERGFRFKTYAGWWVSQKMHRAIADSDRTVRLPVHVVEKIKRIRKVSRILAMRNGEEPGINLLASTLGMTNESLAELMWTVNATDCLDGDAPLSDAADGDGTTTLLNLVRDEQTSSPFDLTYKRELKRIIKQRLSKREAQVVILRFGFGPNGEHTLEEVGEKFKLTRERIRQIEKKALEKLKPILVKVVYEKAIDHGGVFRTWGG